MEVPHVTDYPVLVFVASFLTLWLSAQVGGAFAQKLRYLEEDSRETFRLVVGAALPLLSLIIGFSFSMGASRYDQRKGFEAEEANAILREYRRADLLPDPDGA